MQTLHAGCSKVEPKLCTPLQTPSRGVQDGQNLISWRRSLPSPWYASGCVVECRICNREVAGSNLSLGYFAPRSTQPSIPPGSVNEYQLQLGRQRQVWLIPIADERVGVQAKL